MAKKYLAGALALSLALAVAACAPQVTPTPTLGAGEGTPPPTFETGPTETIEAGTPGAEETPGTAGTPAPGEITATPFAAGTVTPLGTAGP